jgi:hypothetical protein
MQSVHNSSLSSFCFEEEDEICYLDFIFYICIYTQRNKLLMLVAFVYVCVVRIE